MIFYRRRIIITGARVNMEILSRASLCRSWMLYFSMILLTVSVAIINLVIQSLRW